MVGGLSGNNLAIGISLVMRDQFTGRAAAAGAALSRLDKQTQAMQRRQMEYTRNMSAIGAGIGLMAIRGMAQWTKVGAKFDYMMTYVNQIAEKKGGIGFEILSKKAKTLGADTMFSAIQVADAMKFMAMAGQDTEQVYQNITAAVTLAGATMERLEGKGGTADIITNIMRGFMIPSSEANSMRVADVLTTAITSANTNLWDLHEALKYAMSTAKNLQVSFEETASIVMLMGDAGIQGTMAGTAVENMFRYLTKALGSASSKRQRSAIAAMGLDPQSFQDAEGGLLSLSVILHKVKAGVEGMGNIAKQNALKELFGVRGSRAASLAIRNVDLFDKYMNMLNTQSSGAASTGLAVQMATLRGLSVQLYSAWANLKIAFTEAIAPVLKPTIIVITKLLKVLINLAETSIGKWLIGIGVGFVLIKTVSLGYRAVILSLRLAHMGMAATFGASAASVVGGYNSMTMAAGRFGAVSRMSGMFGMGGMFMGRGKFGAAGRMGTNSAGRIYDKSTGRYVGAALAARYTATSSGGRGVLGAGKFGAGIGQFGKMAGRMSLPGMLIGGGLQMGANYAGKGTGLGKTLGIAGDTIGMAGTGAMIGSFIAPGIGTAIGAIVGGVGGLLYGLYNRLKETEEAVKEGAAEADQKIINNSIYSTSAWREQARRVGLMKEGESIYAKGYNSDISQMTGTDQMGALAHLLQGKSMEYGGSREPIRITINIDGEERFGKMISQAEYETLVNFGGN